MGDVSDIPVVGRVLASGFVAVDVLLHGGTYVLEIGGAIFAVVLGRPELLVGALGTLERLADRIPFVPVDLVNSAFTVALVAMFVVYVLRFGGHIKSKT